MRRNKTGETSESIQFEYIPLSSGRRLERPFDFLSHYLPAQQSIRQSDSVPTNIPRNPMVIDLISPENESTKPIASSAPHKDDLAMDVVDDHSDMDSSTWTSCEGSPPQLDSNFNEDAGLNDLLEQVADMNEIYHLDQFGCPPQMMNHFLTPNGLDAYFMSDNGGGRMYGPGSMYDGGGAAIETGFPGPMDEFYAECRRKALKVRPM